MIWPGITQSDRPSSRFAKARRRIGISASIATIAPSRRRFAASSGVVARSASAPAWRRPASSNTALERILPRLRTCSPRPAALLDALPADVAAPNQGPVPRHEGRAALPTRMRAASSAPCGLWPAAIRQASRSSPARRAVPARRLDRWRRASRANGNTALPGEHGRGTHVGEPALVIEGPADLIEGLPHRLIAFGPCRPGQNEAHDRLPFLSAMRSENASIAERASKPELRLMVWLRAR